MNNKMMIISPMYVNYNQFLLINRSLLHRTNYSAKLRVSEILIEITCKDSNISLTIIEKLYEKYLNTCTGRIELNMINTK